MDPATEDMGPLPGGDRQDTLQQLSLKALRNLLPEDRFLFRRESEDDKGVDGTLEAKLKVRIATAEGGEEVRPVFTNCRAHVQLKSTDSGNQNQDGSVSYQIETRNLNYLLNGSCPVYFLWIDATGEMRYAWARDEWRRLDAENPEWQRQGKFTVRFRDVLDAKAVEAIHERVIKEARFGREIHETLARSSLAERVAVSINPQTLASDDPQEIFGWITSSGMTIVSSGYGGLVTEWLNVLCPAQRRDARVQLVAAFAQASLGRYQAALGHLAEALMGRAGLSASDQRVLDYLQDVCRYQTGGMDQAEYLRRERLRAEHRIGTSAAEHRMEVLRLERLNEFDRRRRAEFLQPMRETCREIQSAPDAAPAQKILARLNMMFAGGDDLVGRFTNGVMQMRARQDMGFPPHEADRQAGRDVAAAWQRWSNDAGKLIREAEAERHPLLLAEAMTVRLTVYQGFLATHRMMATAGGTTWEPDAALCGALAREVEQVMEVFRRAGSLEGETRAKLLLADFRYLVGDRKSAQLLAEEALVVAQAMCFSRLESHAREYTDGPTSFEQFQATIAARRAQDEDMLLANDTDDRLRELALSSLEAMRLPADRLPVAEREWQSLRLIARERVGWCRHINLMQDKSHTLHPATCYLTDPPRFCVCEKHGYEANIRDPDPEAVINAFKKAYCDGCADRDPKGIPPP
jgi:hypothetical protein